MLTKKNILLVEDDIDDQSFFINAISTLENVALQHISTNGIDALDTLLHSTSLPDLIFMDINMPLMNGLECLAEIIKNPYLKNIPVIMLSTSVQQAALTRAMGACAFIQKPISEEVLRNKIQYTINLDFGRSNHDIALLN
ncbi:MAG TPA: response regulator [Chitinophagales bacterium]|nr:response regulator [Chitinophagales bacterium]